ncbi:hypothetical protein GCM10010421_60380 [Streptomyces glaucus]|uniref:Secreted protein n=1 Tax=Streptomyces glaucus TaxID=284029 RepID=A0ABN3KG28_9ACTN
MIRRSRTGGQRRRTPQECAAWPAADAGRGRSSRPRAVRGSFPCRTRFAPPAGRRPRARPGAVAADKASSSRANHAHLRERHIEAVIPRRKGQAAHRRKRGRRGGRPAIRDTGLHKERATVEPPVDRWEERRARATRFDETPGGRLAGLGPRASTIRLEGLLRAAGRSRHRTAPGPTERQPAQTSASSAGTVVARPSSLRAATDLFGSMPVNAGS